MSSQTYILKVWFPSSNATEKRLVGYPQWANCRKTWEGSLNEELSRTGGPVVTAVEGFILSVLINVRRLTHCGWYHSLCLGPRLNKSEWSGLRREGGRGSEKHAFMISSSLCS